MQRKSNIIISCALSLMLGTIGLNAQTIPVRYVKTTGEYTNDGRSWETAKNNVQEAINDLSQYMAEHNLTEGYVYVAGGSESEPAIYIPTESTEATGGSMLNTSFSIPAGVSVFGGFNPTTPEESHNLRVMKNNKTYEENKALVNEQDTRLWDFKYPSVLSGRHVDVDVTFTFDETRGRYNTVFTGNSYHVVWFGTNGQTEDGRFKALDKPAVVDGFKIHGGNAASKNTAAYEHTAFGGGAYLVGNAIIRNCEITLCAASRQGGGVYMDGGGLMEYCYVNLCQSSGLGIVEGYGGGVSLNGGGTVYNSYITECSARIGGGLAITGPEADPYSAFASAVLVSNNTATAEAGGVYLNQGGSLNHCSVVKNKNIGSNVSYYGNRHGRSGGIMVNKKGLVFNSAVWGNECKANNNIQFALWRGTSSDIVEAYHCAVENHDVTDWSGVEKEFVINIEKDNEPATDNTEGYYTCFTSPATTAGIIANTANWPALKGWQPTSASSLVEKGVQSSTTVEGANEWLHNTNVDFGLLNNRFDPVSTLGAIDRYELDIEVVLITNVETGSGQLPTLFVDPEVHPSLIAHNPNDLGRSWDHPLPNLGEAIDHFRKHLLITDTESANYEKYEFNGTVYDAVQILVKRGTLTTAGPGNFLGEELRTASIRPESNMRIYGGYKGTLTGTDISVRNPIEYRSTITANLTEDGQNKSAHVFSLVNTNNVIVDGFCMDNGAAASSLTSVTIVAFGGGIMLSNQNATRPRHDTKNNLFRNCEIANCTAPEGSAVCVNGYFPKPDNDGTDITEAELTLENCVIRNNTAGGEGTTATDAGTVIARGRATCHIIHCTIVNNTGTAIKTLTEKGYTGNIDIAHSVMYANNAVNLTDRVNVTNALVEAGENITATNCLVDYDTQSTLAGCYRILTYNESDLLATNDISAAGTKAYPFFKNPSRNVGYSVNDMPLYGGIADYMPMNINPMVNRAVASTSATNTDMSANTTRNRGGAADIGAIENTDQPLGGKIKYVRTAADGGSNSNDGNSWQTAYATIDYALSQCTENNGMEIWVAAGFYQKQTTDEEDYIVLKSGVSLYGGFVRYGNPGKALKENERQIGNNELYDGTVAETATKYQTIIDGNGHGRVVSMQDNFPEEAIVEGFTIQNGHNPKKNTNEPIQLTMWKFTGVREYSLDPVADGWDGYDGYEDIEEEVSSDQPYDEVRVVAGDFRGQAGAVKGATESLANRANWTNAVPQASRQGANSEANAYYNASTKYYYYGTGDVTGAYNNDYDWRTGNWNYTYHRYNNYYRYQYTKTTYIRKYRRYYRDLSKSYAPDTEGYPSTYYAETTTGGWSGYSTAGYEPTNIGFPRQGRDYRDGGGVRMYANGIIKNCLIWKNHLRTDGDITFAAGAAMLKGSRMESCIVRNNVVENVLVTNGNFNGITRGAGVHAASSVLVNSLVVENVGLNGYSFDGIGIYTSEKSNFYQCTVAYNFGIIGNPSTANQTGRNYMFIAPGVFDDTHRNVANANNIDVNEVSQFHNCIIWGNAAISRSGYSYSPVHFAYNYNASDWTTGGQTGGIGLKGMLHDCYISVPSLLWANAEGDDQVYNANTYTNTTITANSTTVYGYTNVHNYWVACQDQNLFNESQSGYKFDPFMNTGDYIEGYNTAYLDSDNGTYYTAKNIIARASKNPYIVNKNALNNIAYNCINAGNDASADYLEDNYGIRIDINGADRIQDCQVDKGAYEYNGVNELHPQEPTVDSVNTEIDETKLAIYYVSHDGGGVADASSPENAVCIEKLQMVFDHAGQYLYANGCGDGKRNVMVKMAGDEDGILYYPAVRDSKIVGNAEENILDYSLQIPKGITVLGGYDPTFAEEKRDPLRYKTILSGNITNEDTGAEGQVYHVVKFVDDVFAIDHKSYMQEHGLADITCGRTVLDGITIENGNAYGTDDEDKRGAAAIVPDWAHIRNCVIRNNEANRQGGGLYLEPGALVSGTIVKDNKAAYGGGIFVENPETATTDPAYIISSTVVNNEATTRGGGIYMIDDAEVYSSIFWRNVSRDQANVSFAIRDEYYPFSYCGVETRLLDGVDNISVPVDQDKGARWDMFDPYEENSGSSEIKNFPIMMSSILARAGMPYVKYQGFMSQFPTLEEKDMAGVRRMKQDPAESYPGRDASIQIKDLNYKNNDFIEIGARAINKDFTIDPNNIFHRLFVLNTEFLSTIEAYHLQESYGEKSEIYKQMGSSFVNPFHRVDDALKYIATARRVKPETEANAKFEIFLSGGDYYSYKNALGEQTEETRDNTFLIPERVWVIGGIDDYLSDNHRYCQETAVGTNINITYGDGASITLNGAETDTIRTRRVLSDINQNNVIEPWEFEAQTILTNEGAGGVYHIVTCHADADVLGTLPTITKSGEEETQASKDARTILLDGLIFSNGRALGNAETTSLLTKHNGMGAAILVDGNWNHDATASGIQPAAVGARDIPLMVANCQFENNQSALGGAIASNGSLRVYSSSFVQNSADNHTTAYGVNGGGAIYAAAPIETANTLFANNESADKGGAIYAAATAPVTLFNCNIVRNKAKEYPAIYNATQNTSSDMQHLVANTIFWQNQATSTATEAKHVVNYTDGAPGMIFSAYEEGCGPDTTKNHNETEYRAKAFDGTLTSISTALDGKNQNILIESDNDAQEGPNFVKPSVVSGTEGYMPEADWLISRINSITDQGWGSLEQHVERTETSPGVYGDWVCDFTTQDYTIGGLYNYYSRSLKDRFGLTLLPIALEHYMDYAQNASTGDTRRMDRISSNPQQLGDETTGNSRVFIDLGVYEYQYVLLDEDGSEVDTLWVTAGDELVPGYSRGRTWETATSNVQWAIEQLLQSRNNHAKYLMMKEGQYSPEYITDGSRAYVIATPDDAKFVSLPMDADPDVDYMAKSLTIQGGWSSEAATVRDINQYPTLIKPREAVKPDEVDHLMIIEDAEQKATRKNYLAEFNSHTGTALPISIEGITITNPLSLSDHGGAALYYAPQYHHEQSGGTFVLTSTPLAAPEDGSPKLTLARCQFIANGDATVKPSAVKIAEGGGDLLVVNSLFHSNSGSPLEVAAEGTALVAATAATPSKATVVNTTFALNGGIATLKNENSEIHNSIIWRDNLNNADPETAPQFDIAGETDLSTTRTTYNAIYGIDSDSRYNYLPESLNHNNPLVADNDNVKKGPNFIDPKVDATTLEEKEARLFQINPAVQIMSKADMRTYAEKGLRITASSILDNATNLRDTLEKDLDLAWKARLIGQSLERGPYECNAALKRVIYANTYRIHQDVYDGSSWENAFGQGDLQRALDVASVYSSVSSDQAYVFVKGIVPNDKLMVRAGVSVFGSLAQNFMEQASSEDGYYTTDPEIDRYVNMVCALRGGIAEEATPRTILKGIETDPESEETSTLPALIDGFEITDDAALTASPIDMKKGETALRNCLIHGFNVTGAPVVNMEKGLLYNTLVYGNTANTIVKVGANGKVLNSTIVAENEGETPADVTNAAAGSIVNSIIVNTADESVASGNSLNNCNTKAGMFAPYFSAGKNKYTLPDYLTSFKPLEYQLHEQSACINAADTARTGYAAFDYWQNHKIVDFSYNRDLLGNPRVLGGKIDLGAFETWRIGFESDNMDVLATNVTNPLDETAPEGTETEAAAKSKAYTENYGGNTYPHRGSVLYVMNGSNFVVATNAGAPLFTENEEVSNAIRPGFTLIGDSASIYGQGNTIQLPYVAAERKLKGDTALIAFPFSYSTANAYMPTYSSETDALAETATTLKAYNYDGATRATHNYKFAIENSTAWKELTSTDLDACAGWMIAGKKDTTYRFTGWGASNTDYAYSEDGSAKTVVLTQYDNRTPGMNGEAMNFTRKEDMGWNMRGIPFLVSSYTTGVDDGAYRMHIPHLFYKMGDDGEYLHAENEIYTGRSWDDGEKLALGDAFFTQTAAIGATEDIIFQFPTYAGTAAVRRAPRPLVLLQNTDGEGDILFVEPDENAEKQIQYSLGRDGVKWLSKEMPQIYMMNAKADSRLSLVGSAPLETDMQMGVSIPARKASDMAIYTFSLPEREAFEEYEAVWLIDREMNRTVNLLKENYTTSLPQGESNKRFHLRIGGAPLGSEDNREFIIYAYDKTLYVRGLMEGDVISVYTVNGTLVMKGTATGSEFSCPMPATQGTYTVQVNDHGQNVINL